MINIHQKLDLTALSNEMLRSELGRREAEVASLKSRLSHVAGLISRAQGFLRATGKSIDSATFGGWCKEREVYKANLKHANIELQTIQAEYQRRNGGRKSQRQIGFATGLTLACAERFGNVIADELIQRARELAAKTNTESTMAE